MSHTRLKARSGTSDFLPFLVRLSANRPANRA
jgi:hypothetical protein